MDSCQDAAVASLARQNLCLDHFLSRCYDFLDALDAQRRLSRFDAVDLALTKSFVEDCSRQALDASLCCPNISNLQRGRLLDILLWAGEFFILLRVSPPCAVDVLPQEQETSKQAGAHP
jgi:hypothetical protein